MSKSQQHGSSTPAIRGASAQPPSTGAVWHDDDEDSLMVDLAATSRLRKLSRTIDSSANSKLLGSQKRGDGAVVVGGEEFSSLLQDRFKTRDLEWASADLPQVDSSSTSLVGSGAVYLYFISSRMSVCLSLCRAGLLRQSGSLVKSAGDKDKDRRQHPQQQQPLRAGRIDVVRCSDANIVESSREAISGEGVCCVDWFTVGCV